MVTLAEDLYLLASDGTSGRLLIDPVHLDLGLGGALLLDLAVRERVALRDGHVTVSREQSTGEPLLDSALAEIAGQARPHGPDHWIRHLGRAAHRTVQDHLVNLGILRREDHRVLHVIPMHRMREADGRLHHELVDHLTTPSCRVIRRRRRAPRWRRWRSPSGSTATSSHARTGVRSSNG